MDVAIVQLGSQNTVLLQRHTSEWKLYTAFSSVEKSSFGVEPSGAWLPVRIRVTENARVEVFIGRSAGSVEYNTSLVLTEMTVRVGLQNGSGPDTRSVYYDSVRVSRE
jgi:hypothetical protein